MSERIPSPEDILLALTTVGYTDSEAAEGVENIKRRGVAIGHEMAREATQLSIGGAFRKAQAIAWDEGYEAGLAVLSDGPAFATNPYRKADDE